MRHWMSALTLNQKLAIVALALGAVAIFAVPSPGGRVTLDARELALTISTGADLIKATDLATWIIESRADYRLIDLRSEAEYGQFHIPGAVNISIAGLMDAGLGRQEKLVLYADDGVHAAQAWMLLKAQAYRGAYRLEGGLQAWKDQVVFPVLTENPSAEQRLRDDKRRAMSAFFGGQARSASAMAATGATDQRMALPAAPAIPKVVAPPSLAGGAKPPAKKKKEGC